MNINNPTKFFPDSEGSTTYNRSKYRSTIMTRGDVFKKYASTDSALESDWHFEEDETNDKWVKMSFDGGLTFPLKFKYDSNIDVIFTRAGVWTQGAEHYFAFDGTNETLYELAKEKGLIQILAKDTDEYLTNITDFKYKFNDTNKRLYVTIDQEEVANISEYQVIIRISEEDILGYGVEVPVYSSTTSAIPTIYDNTWKTCSKLDDEISSIECVERCENINQLYLKVVTADSTVTGNVVLNFTCASQAFTQTIPVTAVETWVEIVLPVRLTGVLEITRGFNSSYDTLKDSSSNVISCIITNIKMEIK